MSNCRGCGTVLDPTESAVKHGEICPLCGHSQAQPVSHRKSVQFVLLLAALAVAVGLLLAYRTHRFTERQSAAQDAVKQAESSAQVTELLGSPIAIQGDVTGETRQDETGWHEMRLTIPVRGPKATGILRVSGGRLDGPWKYTTLEVLAPAAKKRADLLTGRIVDYDPTAYQELHTQPFVIPEHVMMNVAPPS